jgi:hypothetical protein
MNELTKKQEDFLQAVKTDSEASIRLCLSTEDNDLLCVIGKACVIAIRTNPKIFDLLTDEKSSYKILRIYHEAKPQTSSGTLPIPSFQPCANF